MPKGSGEPMPFVKQEIAMKSSILKDYNIPKSASRTQNRLSLSICFGYLKQFQGEMSTGAGSLNFQRPWALGGLVCYPLHATKMTRSFKIAIGHLAPVGVPRCACFPGFSPKTGKKTGAVGIPFFPTAPGPRGGLCAIPYTRSPYHGFAPPPFRNRVEMNAFWKNPQSGVRSARPP